MLRLVLIGQGDCSVPLRDLLMERMADELKTIARPRQQLCFMNAELARKLVHYTTRTGGAGHSARQALAYVLIDYGDAIDILIFFRDVKDEGARSHSVPLKVCLEALNLSDSERPSVPKRSTAICSTVRRMRVT